MISTLEVILRLVLATLIGGAIGAERELNRRPAGLRTHILVTLGSALIMLISIYAISDYDGRDPFRLAAQVVSGIGFLGAGTIMRNGNSINGLTTAASLWVCAGLGLAMGSGYYVGGLATAAIVISTLLLLGKLEKRLISKNQRVLDIQFLGKPGTIGKIGTVIGKHSITINNIEISSEDEDNPQMEGVFLIRVNPSLDKAALFKDLYEVDGVRAVSFRE